MCLTLGCGFGGFERMGIEIGIGKRFDESDVAILQLLATCEELQEQAGVIPSDFAAAIAKPRTS